MGPDAAQTMKQTQACQTGVWVASALTPSRPWLTAVPNLTGLARGPPPICDEPMCQKPIHSIVSSQNDKII